MYAGRLPERIYCQTCYLYVLIAWLDLRNIDHIEIDQYLLQWGMGCQTFWQQRPVVADLHIRLSRGDTYHNMVDLCSGRAPGLAPSGLIPTPWRHFLNGIIFTNACINACRCPSYHHILQLTPTVTKKKPDVVSQLEMQFRIQKKCKNLIKCDFW